MHMEVAILNVWEIMFVMNSNFPTLYAPQKYTLKHKYYKRGSYKKKNKYKYGS